jgi:aminopeptidase N
MLKPALALVLAGASLAPAQAQDRYDDATGRNLLNYPPHLYADFIHMRLDLEIADMNTPAIRARETLTLIPVGLPMDLLSLDAKLLKIVAVQSPGRSATAETDGARLDISFDPPLPVGEEAELTIDYEVSDPPDGLYWSPESAATPGRAAQLYSQGEAEMNSYWFPCHDFPNDRLTTELLVTVPAGYTVSSNGHLVEHTTGAAVETWHWLQDKPHVPYLVSLVVGKFDIVDVGSAGLPMPVYAAPGRGPDIRPTFSRTPRMAELFARLTDEPYPWDRYAQVLVGNFNYGGEENTSATTLTDTALLGPAARADTDSEGLISHELAHQWFGDLVTCNSWADIWLNEGFATYFTPLWFESTGGKDAYDAAIRSDFDQVIARDKGTAPDTPGMVSNQYAYPDQVFSRSANPYPKGASILHMLRRRVGDELFFKSIARYIDDHRLGTAETSDLRKSFEAVTGDSLERFFHQWCDRPGVPRLDITLGWETADPRSGRGSLSVSVAQTQAIDGDNPAFAFTLPIWVEDLDGKGRLASIEIETARADASFPLDAEPAQVVVDPDMSLLAELTIHQPGARWLRQLDRAPSVSARIQAARALARNPAADAGAPLEDLARDSHTPDLVRTEAIAALRDRRDGPRLLALVEHPPEDPQVQEAAIDAFANAAIEPAADAGPLLARIFDRESSQLVQAAAVRALGKFKAADQLSKVFMAAGRNSHADRLRQAALDALADLDAPQGLPVAILLSGPEQISRTRTAAIGAIVRLAHHDPDSAYRALAPLPFDRHIRVSEAAGKALVDLADPRAQVDLDRFAINARGDRQKRLAGEWTRALQEKLSPAR